MVIGMDDLELFMATMVTRGPSFDAGRAESLVREHYGIEGSAERLTGERDDNFWLRTSHGSGYVLKIANMAEPGATSGLPTAALLHLERTDPALPCPRVVRSGSGNSLIKFKDESGDVRTAVLYTFLSGKPLMSTARSSVQRTTCGRLLARLARALRSFEHPASHRAIVWDLRQLPGLESLLAAMPELPNAAFIRDFIVRFASKISPRLAAVRHQFVHNDFNARNIIVDSADDSRVTGIIDFGDSVHTALVADVAVGVVGQLAAPESAEEAICDFVRAYCEVEPLASEELAILNWLIAGRIVQNVVITSWHRAHNPAATHFNGFDAEFFGWRIALAEHLVSCPPTTSFF